MGSSSGYYGGVLAAFNDVIVVSINYRLGVNGFFNVPDTDVKGNYGMLDQVGKYFSPSELPQMLQLASPLELRPPCVTNRLVHNRLVQYVYPALVHIACSVESTRE